MRHFVWLVFVACSRSELDGALIDAGANTTVDAPPPHDAVPDAVDADPTAECAGSRDVFFLELDGKGPIYLAGQVRLTNLDGIWTTAASPDLRISVTSATNYVLEVDGLSAPAAGTYAENGVDGPSPQLDLDGEGCSVHGGTLTVESAKYTSVDGGQAIDSLLLSFDGRCSPDFTVHGCIRYAVSP